MIAAKDAEAENQESTRLYSGISVLGYSLFNALEGLTC